MFQQMRSDDEEQTSLFAGRDAFHKRGHDTEEHKYSCVCTHAYKPIKINTTCIIWGKQSALVDSTCSWLKSEIYCLVCFITLKRV